MNSEQRTHNPDEPHNGTGESHKPDRVHIEINRKPYTVDNPVQSGRALKSLAGIPATDVLFLERPHEDLVVSDDDKVDLHNGDRLHSQPPADYGNSARVQNAGDGPHNPEPEPEAGKPVPHEAKPIHVEINRKPYTVPEPMQSGRALKALAGIAHGDVLFLEKPHEDIIVADDALVKLHNGDRLHSQPPADYGDDKHPLLKGLTGATLQPQPDGWSLVIFEQFSLPICYEPRVVRLLIKLPPLFPDAQPDMFWVTPTVRVGNGAAPRGTSMETILNASWQRFSWHLQPGAWRPGVSDLRDFVRCIQARFERKD